VNVKGELLRVLPFVAGLIIVAVLPQPLPPPPPIVYE
jgi:hypothetical protein